MQNFNANQLAAIVQVLQAILPHQREKFQAKAQPLNLKPMEK